MTITAQGVYHALFYVLTLGIPATIGGLIAWAMRGEDHGRPE